MPTLSNWRHYPAKRRAGWVTRLETFQEYERAAEQLAALYDGAMARLTLDGPLISPFL